MKGIRWQFFWQTLKGRQEIASKNILVDDVYPHVAMPVKLQLNFERSRYAGLIKSWSYDPIEAILPLVVTIETKIELMVHR